MDFVENASQIRSNIRTLKDYIKDPNDENYAYAVSLIQRGRCFVVTKDEEGRFFFSPSRFIGYKENNRRKHTCNAEKDGRETNPIISKKLSVKLTEDSFFEQKYINYCKELNCEVHNNKRQYWNLTTSQI